MTRLFGFLVLGRLERLEHLYSVGREEWIDIVLWGASKGGPFGHCHMRILKNGGKTEWTACTEEEELKLMRQQYEECGHRLYGRGEPVAFSVYLETFSYLGPAELADRRREIVERFRGEEESRMS